MQVLKNEGRVLVHTPAQEAVANEGEEHREGEGRDDDAANLCTAQVVGAICRFEQIHLV